jgi:hypothetical protein
MMSQERVAQAIVQKHGIPLPQATRIARAAADRHRGASSGSPITVAPAPEAPVQRPITRDELARALSIVSKMSLGDATNLADGVLLQLAARR